MKALILDKPRQFRLEEREMPDPGPEEVRVRIHHGGICGSDIHYYQDGGFGTVRMTSPMVLGHELSGTVETVGSGVTRVAPGDLVAVNPSLACGSCRYCRQGMARMCSDMRFMGSAMRTPPVEGGFREFVTCTEAQAVPLVGPASLREAALAEPLAVCLHAVAQGPDLKGARVLVTGFGPIGALTFLAARQAGAAAVMAADVAPRPLALATTLAADTVFDASDPAALDAEKDARGQVDVVFECSGHPNSIREAIDVTRPGGTIIQVGMTPNEVPVTLNPVITKEITYRGTFRFDAEFERAVHLIGSREIDVRPVISGSFPPEQAEAAFACAMDRAQSIKVLLDFA